MELHPDDGPDRADPALATEGLAVVADRVLESSAPPFNLPAADTKHHPEAGLQFRPNVHLATEGQPVSGPAHPLSSSDAPRQAAQGYYGGITGVDLEFARLLDTLDKTGLTENTIVIYTSDHGEMMGSHGRMAKQVPFEESCRVPFFIRYLGITPPGQSSQALFSAMDIYPTLCGLAGIALPAGRGGRDLSDILRGRRAASPADVVFLMNQMGRRATGGAGPQQDGGEDVQGALLLVNQPTYRGVPAATHTYAVMEGGRWCLDDNIGDPYQMHNLVQYPAQRELMTSLDAQIQAWLTHISDSLPLQTAVGTIAGFPA